MLIRIASLGGLVHLFLIRPTPPPCTRWPLGLSGACFWLVGRPLNIWWLLSCGLMVSGLGFWLVGRPLNIWWLPSCVLMVSGLGFWLVGEVFTWTETPSGRHKNKHYSITIVFTNTLTPCQHKIVWFAPHSCLREEKKNYSPSPQPVVLTDNFLPCCLVGKRDWAIARLQ